MVQTIVVLMPHVATQKEVSIVPAILVLITLSAMEHSVRVSSTSSPFPYI